MSKMPVDRFVFALLYEDRRAAAGIPLDYFGARHLLDDPVALVAYWSQWTPDFDWSPPKRRTPLGPQAIARAALGIGVAIVIVGAFIALIIAIAAAIAHATR